jgi:hypothetical protein
MKREIILGVAGLGAVLTAVLVLWPKERSFIPEMPAPITPHAGTEWKSVPVEARNQPAAQMPAGHPLSPHADPSSRQDIDLVLESLEAEPDLVRGEELMQASVDSVDPTDLPAVIASLQDGNQTPLSVALRLRLLRRWAGKDPQAAADWIDQTPAGEARQEAINGVAIEWANQSLVETLAWARRLPEGAEQQGALLNTAYEAARTAPTEALAVAAEITDNQEHDNLVTHAALQWAAVAPAQAAAWAKQINDAALRQRVLTGVATAWGESDPVSAAKLALQSVAPGRLQDDAVIGIVQRWVQNDPKAAAVWVSQFPKGQLRQTAIEIINSLGKNS